MMRALNYGAAERAEALEKSSAMSGTLQARLLIELFDCHSDRSCCQLLRLPWLKQRSHDNCLDSCRYRRQVGDSNN